MEVTQSAEHVTHALVGSRETIDMGVAETAAFFTMMSSTLYSDQKLACVREVLCNAWDAHIDSNRTDTPLEITLTDDQMIIRDFGYGIPHKMIGPIYGVYGQSTKAKDVKSTGGFGLGSKAPFAYTEHFRVISAHEGVRTVYQMSKSSSEVEGKPSIDVIVSTPTTSSGLTVIIDINHNDFIKFESLIKGVVANGEMLVDLNEERLSVLPFSKAEHGFLLTSEKPLNAMQIINIRYGTVVYPLEPTTEINDLYVNVYRFINSLNFHNSHTAKQLRLVLQAPPNTITVTPSRETLSMQKRTIETVCKLLKDFHTLVLEKFEPACDPIIHQLTTSFYKDHPEVITTSRDVIDDDELFDNLRNGDQTTNDTDVNIYTPISVSKYLVATRQKLSSQQTKKLYLQKLKGLMPKLELGMLGAAQNLYSIARRTHPSYIDAGDSISSRVSWLKKQIINPLISEMEEVNLSANRLFLHDTVFDNWMRFRQENVKQSPVRNVLVNTSMSITECLPYLEPVVVLTHNQRDCYDSIGTHFRQLTEGSYRDTLFKCWKRGHPYFFYVVPRNTEAVKEAKNFFAKTPFTVYDVTKHQVATTTRHTSARPSRPRVNRRTGYARLDGMKQGDSLNVLFTQTDEAPRITEPSFYVAFDIKKATELRYHRLPALSLNLTEYVIDNFGTEGAITVTPRQQEKCEEAGIPTVKVFLAQKLYTQVMSNKRVLQYLANSNFEHNLNYDDSRILKMILKDTVLAKKHNISSIELTDDEQLLIEYWNTLQSYVSVSDMKAFRKKLKPSKQLTKLISLIDKNTVLPVIDFYELRSYLKSNDSKLIELARYILTTLLRKGK